MCKTQDKLIEQLMRVKLDKPTHTEVWEVLKEYQTRIQDIELERKKEGVKKNIKIQGLNSWVTSQTEREWIIAETITKLRRYANGLKYITVLNSPTCRNFNLLY